MKQLLLAALLAALVPFNALANDTKGLTIEKSFLQSVHDCAEYLQVSKHRLVQYLAYEFPPDDETKCLIYCVGTDLRWWNNTCGLQIPAIVNFFQPVLGDRQYEKRTSECLERNVYGKNSPNSCCKAYDAFQCYFREFGNLVTCPQYVPATQLQATQAALDCLNMLRVPVDLLKCYSKGNLPDVPETRCLYHCIDHRTGLYTTESGLCLSRFYVRDFAKPDLRYLSKETKACRDRIRQSGCDVCSEVYNTHRDCLAGIGVEGYTGGIITEAARIALTNLGVCCEEPPRQASVEQVEEVGYSYASYQPAAVASGACKTCGTSKVPFAPVLPRPAVVPAPVVTFKSPVYAPRPSACSSCGSVPKVVPMSEKHPAAETGGHRPPPYVKHVAHPGSGRPQLMYYLASAASSPPAVVEPCSCSSSQVVSKPAFSAFSPRSYPERSHGPYPSCRTCKAEHFGVTP
ncbi:uncharacterized protein LOC118503418 [Anopheles stephensi]|uniref:uncharacterized protein LOC118503418 n=1 Tax=Anopheles stephensi TaxID=30069 RepID=UPI001658B7BE|nr:uncharacterized protein LOC118503418 [Anopheles stephensi]